MTTELERYFTWKCQQGLIARGLSDKKEYQDRLAYEIEVITAKNICGYFLVVQDFIQWAKQNEVPVGPGRGSGVGALTTYCLGITNVDPVKYGLLFERFISPERKSYPDLDIDFSQAKRNKIVEYLTQKYGADRVAHIGTFGILRAKAAVRESISLIRNSTACLPSFSMAVVDLKEKSVHPTFR